MIMTDAGFSAIEASSRGPLSRVMSWLGFAPRDDQQPGSDPLPTNVLRKPPFVPQFEPQRPLHEPARLAESYASHALVSARNGGYAEAESYFREAFALDRKLTPDTLANFWQLPRPAHEAASRALIAAGRDDEAVDLVREISDRAMLAAQPHLQRAAS